MMQTDAKYKWFSIPIEVKGVPTSAGFVTISLHVDFKALLDGFAESGTVDERTLRLSQIKPDGSEVEQPVQFSPDVQARHPGRHLCPGTQETVSWGSDWPADETPSDLSPAGTLTWIAQARPSGICQYRLLFGVPGDGIFVQVPFPPGNLRHFDAQGRATPVPRFPRMQIRPQWPLDGVVHILRDGEILASYHMGPTGRMTWTARRPYLYPANGPDGISLTELGKPHDPTGSHAHHYSLWIAHASVDGADFWSEQGGLIRHQQFELMEDGPVFARLVQRAHWVTQDQVKLSERRRLTFYATPEDFRLIDVELELSPGGSEPVELGVTPFGFLAARVAQSMTVFHGGGEIVNALGQRNEQGAHRQAAAWIDQSGPVKPEKWGGVALFDHPHNVNHPTNWHCRNDGWAGASLNLKQARIVKPGHPLKLCYRVHLHRHDAIRGEVSRRYEEYACKPAIQFGIPGSRPGL